VSIAPAFVLLVVAIAANQLWPLEFVTWSPARRGRSSTCSSIEYAVVRDDLSGGPLVVPTLYAARVPVLIGFTVAR